MATQNLPSTQTRTDAIGALLNQEAVKKRFEQVLGKKAPGFMSSVISAVNANKELKNADPITVVSAAAVAASLDLPINPSLGFAHIVPYKRDGVPIAQFQMGWRGFVQLGMRSSQYKTLNVSVVYEGELVESNRFTGEMIFDEKCRTSDKIIGYVAYFKLLNGFEKYLYMTVEQATAHGKKYSKSFGHASGRWQTDFDTMALKTTLKMLLSKFGILSVEMQTAVQLDQSIVKTIDGNTYDYIDNPENDDVPLVPEETENTADIIATFDAAIPSNVDAAILEEFLQRTAASNKASVDAVKVEFMKDMAAFWKIFNAYKKQMKAKNPKADAPTAPGAGTKTPETVEMAPGECPDSPLTIYAKSHCDTCTKRSGCPVWG